MKQIKRRRRFLRIGHPIGFSLFCLVCLALVAGLYLGISWAIKNGPGVVKAMRTAVQEEVLVTPTVEPSQEPAEELLPTPTPTPTPEVKDTPALGTPVAETPTPEPTAFVTADPNENLKMPLSGQTIGLDAYRDGNSKKFGSEAAYNLMFAKRLKLYLESQGANVVLSRTDDTKGTMSNEERGRIFKDAKCDYVVRLMCNYPNSKNSSTYVRCSKDNQEYALTIVDAYSMATGIRKQSGSDRKNGVKIESDSVATGCGCPCALLILGNWDSSKERKRLQDEEFMEQMCEGIFNGLVTVVNGAPPAGPTEISDETVPEPAEETGEEPGGGTEP